MPLSGYITLDEAKDQVSIEHENSTHDDRLERLIIAGEEAAVNFLNIDSLDDLQNSPQPSPATIPETVKSAILMHVEIQFDRDDKLMEGLQTAFERLLWPYRQGLGL